MSLIAHKVPCLVRGLTERPCLYSAPVSVSPIALRGENGEPGVWKGPVTCGTAWRPLQVERDTVTEESVSEESWAWLLPSSDGVWQRMRRSGQGVSGVQVVPEADADGGSTAQWRPWEAGACGIRRPRGLPSLPHPLPPWAASGGSESAGGVMSSSVSSERCV